MERRNLIGLAALAVLASLPLPAWGGGTADRLRVVTTIPDLADIVREIGGDRVEVASIARGKENTHAVPVKPSHLVAMSKADLFVQVGLSLESTYVPGLLQNCRNEAIQPGRPGFLNVSQGWQAIDVPTSLSREKGDVHPQGNPHLNLDPRGGRHIAERVLEALVALDPGHADAYRSRHTAYLAKLEPAEQTWAEQAQAWAGKKVVVYHQEYNYLAAGCGLVIAGNVEPWPGIPPTPNHIAELIDRMKSEGVRVILTAVWSNNATVARIAEETGARVVELPNMCGGLAGTDTWIGMMDVIHERLRGAFEAKGS